MKKMIHLVCSRDDVGDWDMCGGTISVETHADTSERHAAIKAKSFSRKSVSI